MWFDPISAWVVALFTSGIPLLTEKTAKSIPAENWANKELLHKDRMAGVSEKEILQRVKQGRYYIPPQIKQAYPVPHRDPESNKILIENCELHRKDIDQYGTYKAYNWVEQGKYNLNASELKITHLQYEKNHLEMYKQIASLNEKEQVRLEEIKTFLASTPWDCRKTEAVLQWERAHTAENKFHQH